MPEVISLSGAVQLGNSFKNKQKAAVFLKTVASGLPLNEPGITGPTQAAGDKPSPRRLVAVFTFVRLSDLTAVVIYDNLLISGQVCDAVLRYLLEL